MAEEQDREGMQSAPVGPCSKMYTAAVTFLCSAAPTLDSAGGKGGTQPLEGGL